VDSGCPLWGDYLIALQDQGWTPEILEHITTCSACNEAVFAICLRDRLAVAMNVATLPAPDSIWWLAALERQRRAVRRPDLTVYRAAMTTCLLGAAVTAALLWTRSSGLIDAAAALVMLAPALTVLGLEMKQFRFFRGKI
jgi:hypothetical protein